MGSKKRKGQALNAHGRAQDARGGRCSRDEYCAEALGKPCHGAVGAVLSRVTSEGAEVERLHASAVGQAVLLHANDASACGGELSIRA